MRIRLFNLLMLFAILALLQPIHSAAQTAPSELFGTGRDGDLVVGSGQTVYGDNVRTAMAGTAAAGQKAVPVANTAGFNVDDEVLIIQMQGTGAGTYELRTIASISGGTLILGENLESTYRSPSPGQGVTLYEHENFQGVSTLFVADAFGLSAFSIRDDRASSVQVSSGFVGILCEGENLGGPCEKFTADDPYLGDNLVGNDTVSSIHVIAPFKAQVIKVPHYQSVTIQGGGTLTAHVWDGSSGGIIVARINDTIEIQAGGAVRVEGKGYKGGFHSGGSDVGFQGESHPRGGDLSTAPNAGGGGAGTKSPTTWESGGGGGGFGTSGQAGVSPGSTPGSGGTPYGSPDLGTFFLGSGGGSGGSDGSQLGGDGGPGGGGVLLFSQQISVGGPVSANGSAGSYPGLSDGGGGGGGSGGAVRIVARIANLGANLLTALGGQGGAGGAYGGGPGGAGGVGRIRIEYCDTLSGSTNPSASVQQIDCIPPNSAPTVAVDNASVVVDEGQIAPNTGTYSDANSGDDVTISASIGTVTKTGTNSGTWSWSFLTTDGPAESQTVIITADDGNGGVSTTTFSLTVNNVAPTADLSNNGPVNESSPATISFSNQFDASSTDTAAGFHYAYACDGGPLDSTTYANSSTNVSTTCTFDDGPSDHTVRARIFDKDGGYREYTTIVMIDNVNPTAEFSASSPVNEGNPISLSLANPSDPSSADTAAGFTYAFDCGDGSGYEPFGSSSNTSCPTTDDGTRTVRGKIRDKDGGETEYPAEVTISNVAPTITAVTNDGPIDEGDSATITVTATDPAGANDPLSYEFDCNDDGGYEIGPQANNSATCTFGDNGDFRVNVRVKAGDGGEDTDFTIVTVNNVAPTVDTPVVTPEPSDEGSSVTVSATFSDPGANDGPFTCTIDYGDDSVIIQGSVIDNLCTGSAHTYADNGNYPVSISVTDKNGSTGSNSTTHVVNNVAPTVEAITAPIDPVQVNTEINSSANFTDPGTADTHTAVWDWGDGSQCDTDADTDCIVTENAGSGSVSGNHTYAEPGVYTVMLTVTDKDGAPGEAIFQYVVVYDQSAGFVTGAGLIDSPEGAYTQDPTLTGKAHFGFVARYEKGATEPVGQTQFRFKVADLDFHSTSYQWLVVAGSKAQFKGDGTINGLGNYGFMLTAIDEKLTPRTDVDLFRIKIWDKDNDDTIVYDNQVACADDGDEADPCTEISGGNIVIHKK